MTELLLEGDRVVVVGGPWPERKGCHGVIVGPPKGAVTYPWAGLGPDERVVLLDDDPLAAREFDPARPFVRVAGEGFSCVVHQEDLKIWRIAQHVQPPGHDSSNNYR